MKIRVLFVLRAIGGGDIGKELHLRDAVERAERRISRNADIRENDIELALVALDSREKPIKIGEVRYVTLNGCYVASDLLYCSSQLGLTSSADKNVRTFIDKLLCRRQANPAIAAGNERNFFFKLSYIFLLFKCLQYPANRSDRRNISAINDVFAPGYRRSSIGNEERD